MTTYYSRQSAMIVALMAAIREQLEAYGLSSDDFHVTRGDAPTKQFLGATDSTKKYQVRVTYISEGTATGRQGFTESLNDAGDAVIRTYTRVEPVQLQIDCYTNFDASDSDSLEGMDLANIIRDSLMQQDTLEDLAVNRSIFISSCSSVNPIYSVNESDNFESTPNFDIQLTYNIQYTKTIEIIDSGSGTIYRA